MNVQVKHIAEVQEASRSASASEGEMHGRVLIVQHDAWLLSSHATCVQHQLLVHLDSSNALGPLTLYFYDAPMDVRVYPPQKADLREFLPSGYALQQDIHHAKSASMPMPMTFPSSSLVAVPTLLIQFKTPAPSREGPITLVSANTAIPCYTLRVHETARLRRSPEVEFSNTQIQASWFNVPPSAQLQHDMLFAGRCTRPGRCSGIAMYLLLVIAVGTVAMLLGQLSAAQTTQRRVTAQIEALAMALDVDLADGSWDPQSMDLYEHL